jgi:hypothetical protein
MTDRPKVDWFKSKELRDLLYEAGGRVFDDGERSLNIFVDGRSVPLPIPNSAINKIVELLKIPDKEEETFAAEISVIHASYLLGRKRGPLEHNLSSLRRIAVLSRELLTHLERLNPAGKIFLRIRTLEGHLAVRDYVAATRTLMESAALLGKQKRPRNRPSGSVKSSELIDLVCELQHIANETGGKLTLGRRSVDLQPTGSLPAILAIFQKHFPSLPAHVSYQTLYRIRQFALKQKRRIRGTPTRIEY